MNPEIRIRRATVEDNAELVRFQVAMARESEDKGLDAETLSAGISYLLEHAAEGFYLVAEVDGVSAGSLMVTFEWSDWRDGRFWWIQSVYVDVEFRRQGVYRALHTAIGESARADAQACGLRLYVEQENNGAQQTYRNLGMHQTHYQIYEEEF